MRRDLQSAESRFGTEPPEAQDLAVNHRYLLRWMERTAGEHPGARMLDYGCGRGEVVAEGRSRGLAVFGAEVFFEGGDTRPDVAARGLLGDAVREIVDECLDFEDGSFDLVVANQVFEHIEDFEPVLDEIHRVLKPGGRLLALFPSLGVVREGHSGIPIVHWMPAGRFRRRYATALRAAGLGYNTFGKTPGEWAEDMLQWLDRFTFYRTKTGALEPFARRFRIRLIEEDYAGFRLRQSRRLARFASVPRSRFVAAPTRIAIRRLTGMVILGEKSSEERRLA